MKQVIGYIRVSSNGQVENGSGLDRQREHIETYCQRNGWNLVEVVEDRGISGTLYDREGLDRVFNHPVKSVIVEGLDRLCRDLLVSEKIIYELKQKGIELVSIKEGRELLDNNPSRVLIRQMMSSIYQFEKSNLVERLRVSRERIRKETGKCEGSKSIKEVSPEIYKEMKQLRRNRKGTGRRTYEEISQILNDKGYRTRRGFLFTGKNIQRILSN